MQMTDDANDEDGNSISSVSTVSTYDEGDHGDEGTHYVSDWRLIEQNSPQLTNLVVLNWDDFRDDVPLALIYSRDDWINLGRAIGENTTITRLIFVADSETGTGDPIRSTEVRDAFYAELAKNRSVQVFSTSGLEYTSGQIQTMRHFFTHSAHLAEICFHGSAYGSALEPSAIAVLIEAIKERGENIKTIRSFTYSLAAESPSQVGAMVDLARSCTHLTHLTLSRFSSGFDLSSCQAIATLLADKNCMLRKLDLSRNCINDEGCRVIAESLRNNRRLRWLGIDSNGITGRGFASFIPVICDASDIESTLNSNHVLESVSKFMFDDDDDDDDSVQSDLIKILEMNEGTDKATTASLKVLRCHFNGDFDLVAVAGLGAKALPHLLSFFGKLKNSKCADFKDEVNCLSTLYRITRHNPEICGHPSNEKVARLKAEDLVTTMKHKLDGAEAQIEKLQNALMALERQLEELRENKRQKKEDNHA